MNELIAYILTQLGLTLADYTVRAQAVDPANMDGVIYQAFLRRNEVGSMQVAEVTTKEFRQVAVRRPWDAEGNQYQRIVGPVREAKFTPIDMFDILGEEAINDLVIALAGGVLGQEAQSAVFRRVVEDMPTTIENMAMACERRMNIEAAEAWASGTFTVVGPGGTIATHSYGFDAQRHQTAATAWDDGGVNSVQLLIAWLRIVKRLIPKGIVGLRMSSTLLYVLLADAPPAVDFTGGGGYVGEMTQAQLEQYVASQSMNPGLRFVIDDYTYETAPGTHVRYWPEKKLAVIPRGGYVGSYNVAPVITAATLARQVPEAKINRNGKAVIFNAHNNGKALRSNVQWNAYPWLNENDVAVIDTDITV